VRQLDDGFKASRPQSAQDQLCRRVQL